MLGRAFFLEANHCCIRGARGRALLVQLGLSAGLFVSCPVTPHAQTVSAPPTVPQAIAPSQITRGGNREDPIVIPQSQASRLDLAVIPLEAPPGSETLRIAVSDLKVSGSFDELADAHARFRQEVVGHAMSLADVYAAAGKLEAAYAKAGYVLARVTIPPQRIENDGTLRVEVVDGTIEAVDDVGIPKHIRSLVRARLAALVGQSHLRLAEIERRLTLAGATPGLSLRSALKAGTRPGTTRLVVEGKLAYASFDLTWDNSLPASLGSNMLTASATLNDVAGLGEQITLATSHSDNLSVLGSDSSPFALQAVWINLPLGTKGLSLSASHIQSRTLQEFNPRYLTALGHFYRTGASLNVSLVARHDANLVLSVGEDTVAQSQALPFFGLTVSRDAYTSLRLGLTGWRRYSNGGYASAEFRMSQGLSGRHKPTSQDVPFSQAGARNNYTKLAARMNWRAELGSKTSLTVTGNGQTSFGSPLFVSERLAISAADGISATVSGQLVADSGFSLRDELARAFTINGSAGPIVVSTYGFTALGIGWLEQPGGRAHRFDVSAIGAGMRLNAPIGRGHASFGLEYGHCFCSRATGSNDNRLNLAASLGL